MPRQSGRDRSTKHGRFASDDDDPQTTAARGRASSTIRDREQSGPLHER